MGGFGGLQARQGDGDRATAGVGVVERHGDVRAVGARGVQALTELVVGTEGTGVPVDMLAMEAGQRIRLGGDCGGRRGGGEHRCAGRERLDTSGS
ncbi:hypothetical protein [Streptomyces sp. NPDC000351]|uniref:hypothetical protein n=1 Tax=Streptomyces sp. NPDC000351 TaxID=3154250 RepID=UPI00332081A8